MFHKTSREKGRRIKIKWFEDSTSLPDKSLIVNTSRNLMCDDVFQSDNTQTDSNLKLN